MKRYDPKTLEPKWQKVWTDTKLYEVSEDPAKQKIYATPMLPYPSGAGLHVGHVRNYSIADAVARFYRQRGYNVMSNMGWDSFGLPAENYAIKTGTPPSETTETNIANFKKQLKRLGMSYAWDREINTSDPDYYKWTQWVFTQLYKHDLAYSNESMVWWDPVDKTVLANEQVIDGKADRSGAVVERKPLQQWFFKITDYADVLLDELANLDWPERITSQQHNWIGRKHGVDITYQIDGTEEHIVCFTTRPDTNFGATFVVIAPEHPFVQKLIDNKLSESNQANAKKVADYVEAALKKSDLERQEEGAKKTGAFTGFYAVNELNGEKMPVWVSDFVLAGFGTGAVVGVPGHDLRDYQFASTFGIPIKRVVVGPNGERGEIADESDVQEASGKMINSGFLDGMEITDAIEVMKNHLVEKGWAERKTSYRIRDWLISRQRYWGVPIPIVWVSIDTKLAGVVAEGNSQEKVTRERDGQTELAVAVPEKFLPVELPDVETYAPDASGLSPLARQKDWVEIWFNTSTGEAVPRSQQQPGEDWVAATRETDTMDGYACSSWYMHRYTDAQNAELAWDPAKVNYWFPVDFYFGGDHAVSHLLYFRFWNHFFADQGLIDADKAEPVKKLVFNGYINAEDGRKMSKSLGNVVDPLEIIDSGYGADALRLFELFVGPYEQDVDWNTNGVPGTFRFLNRVWTLVQEYIEETAGAQAATNEENDLKVALKVATHKTIKKVTEDLESLKFNTAIAASMELVNTLNKLREDLSFTQAPQAWRESLSQLVQILAPFAPHMSEELWEHLGYNNSVHIAGWPVWEQALIEEELITIVVQVNGKVRANIEATPDEAMKDIVARAREDSAVQRHLENQEIIKTIEVPHKLVNFVVRPR